MSKSILEEAMADAKLLKETAIENAKNVLVEAISPQIKEFVEGELGEAEKMDDEEVGLEVEPEPEEEAFDGMYEAKDEEDDEEMEEASDPLKEEDEVVEITQEDLKQAFSEVLGDVKTEATVSKAFGDVEDPTPKTAGGKQQTGIADEKSGESHWKDEEPPAAQDWTVKEVAYKNKISKLVEAYNNLREETNKWKQACSYLKRNLQEVNLFNSKLLYTNKLIQSADLSNKQRVGVIESFDRATSLREVELVYKSLSESLKIAGVMGESRKVSKTPKSSRYTTSSGTSKVLEESLDKESGKESFADRMQRLSGLID